MNAKTVVVALVGLGCIGAAGVGAYLGVRSTANTAAAPAAVRPAAADAAKAPETSGTPVPAIAPPVAEAATPSVPSDTKPKAAPAPRVKTSAPKASAVRAPAPVSASAPAPPQPALAAAPAAADLDAIPPMPAAETAALPEAPPAMEERVVDAASVIGIRLDSSISSETARVEDRVVAHVTRDVKVEGQTVIPAGARLDGVVTLVERGGKMRDRARIGIRFDSLVIGDDASMKLPIQTETIFRDGEPPANEASSKIGASAVVGTILGAMLGGRRGAALGATAGAAGGTAAVMTGDRNAAVMNAGTMLTVRLRAPVSILVPRGN